MQYLKADTETKVVIGPVVAVGDGFTPVTTLAVSTADEAAILKHDAGSVTDISGNTFAAITSADGYFNLTITAAQLDTEGRITVLINDDSLCLPVRHDFMVVSANVYDSLFAAATTDYLQTDAIQVGGTTQTAADLGANTATILTGQPAQKYNGPSGPGVYYDDGAANTTTVFGTDGTVDNPVSTLAACITLVGSLGAKRIYLKGASTIALTGQTLDGYEFVGLNGTDSNTVNLGTAASASVLTSVTICGCKVYGTHDFSSRIRLAGCVLDDAPAAETTKLRVLAVGCVIVGDLVLDTSNDNLFIGCRSGIAGGGYATYTATGAAGTLQFRDHSGGIGLQNLSASHTTSIEGVGQVVFESGCNVNSVVALRGHWSETDNTAGMASVTRDSAYNSTNITTAATAATPTAAAVTGNVGGNVVGSVGSLSAQAKTDVEDAEVLYEGTTTGTGTTLSIVDTGLTLDNQFIDCSIMMKAGTAANQPRTVVSHTSGTVVLNEAMTAAPGSGLAFKIYRDHIHSVAAIRKEIDSNSAQLAAIVEDTGTLVSRVTSTVATLWANLVAMISGSGGSAAFTTTALANAPAGGSSITQQQVRDAMKLAPTAGSPATGSVDEHLDSLITAGSGVGLFEITLTIQLASGALVSECDCVLTTSSTGPSTDIYASVRSDSNAEAVFNVDAGEYWLWRQKAGVNFSNPVALSVDASGNVTEV